jgi:transcription antitermination factor NusG
MNAMTDPSAFQISQIKSLAWVVVVTKPGQEIRAQRCLEDRQFETYLPMKLFENRFHRLASSPFFPRYMFAQIDVRADAWWRIFSTDGVSSLLGATPNRPPIGVAPFVIERIRAQEEAGYIRMMGGPAAVSSRSRTFEPGEVVRMAGSPLEAVFIETVDAKRAVILVSLLGRDSRHTVDLAKLRSATED